jgi:hypothetical protein
MIISWHFISNTMCVCVIWTTVSATFIWTWFVITMFKLRCILCCELLCNLWWWPLNLVRSWLLCEMVSNPSGFHRLPGYTGLSLLNCLLVGWFSYLISFNWVVLLHHTTTPLRYRDGRDTGNCRFRCRDKCKTLRNLPSGHGIELVFLWLSNYRPHPMEPKLAKVGS